MIKYKLVNRKNPQDQADPGKFYASLNHDRKSDMRDVAERITKRSTVSTIDAMAVLEAFTQVIPEMMAEGDLIQLGDFGTFFGTIKSAGSATKDEFHTTHIQKMKLHFRPGAEFKKTLRNLVFSKTEGSSNGSAA